MARAREQRESRLPPLVLRWHHPSQPLPLHTLQVHSNGQGNPFWQEAPSWVATGPHDQPFDFCGHVHQLLQDITTRCPTLRHVEVSRILLGITRARSPEVHGLQARVTPLRFHNGELTKQRRGVTYQVQRYFLNDHEFLYLLTFCLPRFLNQDFDNKLITLFHELFHIHPDCNGDLRRHAGRCALHTHSQKKYDAHMADLARAYLAHKPPPDLLGFLRLDFAQLCQRHGAVCGVIVPRPKIVPIS